MGNQAGIIIRNVKNELFHSAKRLILNEVKGIERLQKVMQDYNQHRNSRSLRKYCKDEAIDYDWVIKFKKTYPVRSTEKEEPADGFVPLANTEEPVPALEWAVS